MGIYIHALFLCPSSVSFPSCPFLLDQKNNGISPSSFGLNGISYVLYCFPYPIVYNDSDFSSMQEWEEGLRLKWAKVIKNLLSQKKDIYFLLETKK